MFRNEPLRQGSGFTKEDNAIRSVGHFQQHKAVLPDKTSHIASGFQIAIHGRPPIPNAGGRASRGQNSLPHTRLARHNFRRRYFCPNVGGGGGYLRESSEAARSEVSTRSSTVWKICIHNQISGARFCFINSGPQERLEVSFKSTRFRSSSVRPLFREPARTSGAPFVQSKIHLEVEVPDPYSSEARGWETDMRNT